MKASTLGLLAAKQYFKYVLQTKPQNSFVVEWKDSETNEVYNISGHGGRTKARQLLNYINMLTEKNQLVRENKTNTDEFFKLIMNQNGGNRGERCSGFAGNFPNGSEMSVKLSIAEFEPHERVLAQQLNKTLKQTFTKVCRVDLAFDRKTARNVILKKLESNVIVDADTARSVRFFKQAA
jgi:hypothetical protein